MKSGLYAGGLSDGGSKTSFEMTGHEMRESGERPSSPATRHVGICVR
jgi:hypothetical protein